MWPIASARGRHRLTTTSSLVILALSCLLCHLQQVLCQKTPYRNLSHGDRQHRFRSRTLRGRGRIPDLDEDEARVIIEEPEDVNAGRAGAAGRVDGQNKPQGDAAARQRFVSPWEPPLFQWIYNPELLERNARYFDEQAQKRGERQGGNTDRRGSGDFQAMSSLTERRNLPKTRVSQARQRHHQRHGSHANRGQHYSRPHVASNLPHTGEQVLMKLDADRPSALPRPIPRPPRPADKNVFSFSPSSSPADRGRGAGAGRGPARPLGHRQTSTRRVSAASSLASPPGASHSLPRRAGADSSGGYRNPSQSRTASNTELDVHDVSGHSAHTGQSSRGVNREDNRHSGSLSSVQFPGNVHHAGTCQSRLETCQNSELELRRLQTTYQENLEKLKQLLVQVIDRVIEEPGQLLDDSLCDIIGRQEAARRQEGADDFEVTDDFRGGRSGQDSETADPTGHTRSQHQLGGRPDDLQPVVTTQDNLGTGDRDRDTDTLISLSRRRETDDEITTVGSGRGGRHRVHGTKPGSDSSHQRSVGSGSMIVVGPHGTQLNRGGRVVSGDAATRLQHSGDSSGGGVRFDGFDDLEDDVEEEEEELDTESERTQKQVWETWRQHRGPDRLAAEKKEGPDCILGDWTEWTGPVGFGVIERRRFVVGGDSECKAQTQEGDLLMRVDIAVFNANHTYYKPPEEVGQDFELDFTRSFVPRDLLLVIDASGSIEEEDFELIREGMAVMVDLFCGGFGTESTNNRLAIIMFASEINILHSFNDDQSADALSDVIANMTQPNGNTCTGDALKLAHDVIFSPENGARPEVVHDTLLLTDGHSNCGEVTIEEGAQLLQSVSNIYALGVGIANDTEARHELKSVVSNNEPRHIFSLERFQDFKDMVDSIQERQKTLPCLPIVDVKQKKVQ